MVVFRADANADIGEGHLMRCVAIAKELLRLGEEVVFVTADERPCALLAREGLAHIVLNTDWTRMEGETAELLPLLENINADCMLVDSYYASPGYFKSVKGKVRTAYMDDLGLQVYPADIVINYNAYYDSIPYEKMYANSDTRLLLGPMYAPLRAEFRPFQQKPLNGEVSDILITTGGTDPYHFSSKLASAITRDGFFDGVRIHLIFGRYYTNGPELEEISRTNQKFIIHENVTSMSRIMRLCDIAVSAGGTTVYELCACGVPSVIFSFADNQTRIREYLGSRGAAIDCGDYRHLKEICLNRIIDALRALKSEEKRAGLRRNAVGITDGRGAARLAACLSVQNL